MKELMSIKERTILIMILLALIIGIGIGMSIKVLGVDAAEHESIETMHFAELPDKPIEPSEETPKAPIVQRKADFCRESTKNAIKMLETEVTTEVTEATTEIVDETTEETEITTSASDTTTAESIPLYYVNGALLDPALQEYAYNTLCALGIGWYWPTFLCQMYQESRFQQSAVSAHGAYGICQIKAVYQDYFKELAGLPDDADLVNDPFVNIHIGAFLMSYYYNQCFDVNTAISAYNTGFIDKYNAEYVAQVRQWESTIERVQ